MTPLAVALALEQFGATVVAEYQPVPGYAWCRCVICGEDQLRARKKTQPACRMTPGCKGAVTEVLVPRCHGCGEALTGRSRDGKYCRKECRG